MSWDSRNMAIASVYYHLQCLSTSHFCLAGDSAAGQFEAEFAIASGPDNPPALRIGFLADK
jgi:hypothetical protein